MVKDISVEQDRYGDGDDLPTYQNLVENHGPNSRFGRWKGWVEKRAAERYLDDSPDSSSRRRERGWGDSTTYPEALDVSTLDQFPIVDHPQPPSYNDTSISYSSSISTGQVLQPTHIYMHTFGSRFLPHSRSQIRALLPIMEDHYLLMGTMDGLSMLEMFPGSLNEFSNTIKGPDDAVARELWRGESVHQLAILESSDALGDVPQGVVMALVGAEPSDPNSDKDKEPFRAVRMYNLSSLASLAQWAVSQQDMQVVELQTPSRGNQQSFTKKHRPGASITKSFKALVIDPTSQSAESRHSYFPVGSPQASPNRPVPPHRTESADSADSQWDMVDDLPLRWATDFVPLATSGSKLAGLSVLFFEIWRNTSSGIGGEVMLAVATKNQILLYETPRGERAFRFVKDFYTPFPARKLAFVYQRVADPSTAETSGFRRVSAPVSIDSGSKLCMFVVFEKKAGIIRLNDSAVGEVELFDDYQLIREPSLSLNTRTSRRSISTHEGHINNGKETRGMWTVPVHVSITNSQSVSPMPKTSDAHPRYVYLLTRGKLTHILPSPLPNPINSVRPLTVVSWDACPSKLIARIWRPPNAAAYLQLVAIGEECVQVQEIPLSFIGHSKGKQKAELITTAVQIVGVDTGFLCEGGSWDQRASGSPAARDSIVPSTLSEFASQINDNDSKIGIYAWSQKDSMDWRVFWLGGHSNHVVPDGNVI